MIEFVEPEVLRFAKDDNHGIMLQLQARFDPRPWVEKVAQCVADEVEG
jgi:hypothetical protein